jgi:hypothetical protein
MGLGLRVAAAGVFGRALPADYPGGWFGVSGRPALAAARQGATVPGQEFQEGDGRFALAWTPPEIDGAVYAAQWGNLRVAADLISALRAGDDRVGPTLTNRVLSTLGAPLTFEAAPAGRLRRRALRAAQLEEDFWDMCPESELQELYSWVRIFRVGLAELVWTEPDPADPMQTIARIRHGRNVPRLKVWHPRWLRRDAATGPWLLTLRDGREVVIRPGDGKWVLILGGGPQPWLAAPWIGVANLWAMKWDAATDWAEQGERYANGIIWVDTPDGSTPTDRKEIRDQFKTAGHNPIVVAPPNHVGKILELESAAWETHEHRWELCNRGITICILCNDLSTESKRSAGTGAQLQGEVRDDVKAADARQMETDLRAQVLGPWALANFGDAELAPWPVADVEPAADQQATATAWAGFANAIATFRKSGVGIDLDAVEELTGIPITGEIEPVPAPAAPMGARAEQARLEEFAAEVEGFARHVGLRAALETAAQLRGAPLTEAESRALARMPAPLAARELASLFGDRTPERRRARALAQARRQRQQIEREAA